MPLPRTPIRRRRGGLLAASLAIVVAIGGCGDDGESGGFGSAREVVDAHVAASAAYDLAADCELRHPDVLAEFASLDGRDADGYCAWATAGLLADATAEERDRTAAIYTAPVIEAVSETDDRATFTLEAADGSYHEDIVAVRIDGRWFLESADGTDTEHDHEH